MSAPRWSTRVGPVRWTVHAATTVLTIDGPLAQGDVRRVGTALVRDLAIAAPRMVVCRGDGLASADLGVVDLLARLQQVARAHGYEVRIEATPRLRELVGLAGLDECLADCWSAVEGRHEPGPDTGV